MGHDDRPRIFPLPLPRHGEGLFQALRVPEKADLRKLWPHGGDEDQIRFKGHPCDQGRLVPSELVLPSEPLDAVLSALCFPRPPLEDGVAEPLGALGQEDERLARKDRLLGILHRLLKLVVVDVLVSIAPITQMMTVSTGLDDATSVAKIKKVL